MQFLILITNLALVFPSDASFQSYRLVSVSNLCRFSANTLSWGRSSSPLSRGRTASRPTPFDFLGMSYCIGFLSGVKRTTTTKVRCWFRFRGGGCLRRENQSCSEFYGESNGTSLTAQFQHQNFSFGFGSHT